MRERKAWIWLDYKRKRAVQKRISRTGFSSALA